jgi:hypothetical protein
LEDLGLFEIDEERLLAYLWGDNDYEPERDADHEVELAIYGDYVSASNGLFRLFNYVRDEQVVRCPADFGAEDILVAPVVGDVVQVLLSIGHSDLQVSAWPTIDLEKQQYASPPPRQAEPL